MSSSKADFSVGTRESSKIFVAKIPVFVTQKELYNAFIKFGTIEETKLLFHEDGAFRGCAFIKFAQDEFAYKALEVNGTTVFAKEKLVVRMAEDKRTNQRKKQEALARQFRKKVDSEASLQDINPSLAPIGVDAFYWTHELQKKDGWGNVENTHAWDPLTYIGPCNSTFSMHNYGFDCKPSIWTEYYTSEGIPYFHNAQTGLTQWEKPEEFEALSYPKSEFNENDMSLPHLGLPPHLRNDIDSDNGKLENSVSGCAEDVEGRHGPAGCNLFVFHLPDEWLDADLYKDFAPFGNIVSAKVMKETSTQRSRGFGFVSYDCRESALLAIKKMQGFQAGKKRLKVDFKKGEGASMFNSKPAKPFRTEARTRRNPTPKLDARSTQRSNEDPKLNGFIRAATERGMSDLLLYSGEDRMHKIHAHEVDRMQEYSDSTEAAGRPSSTEVTLTPAISPRSKHEADEHSTNTEDL